MAKVSVPKISKNDASKAVNNTADFAKENWQPLLVLAGIGAGVYLVGRLVKRAGDGFNFGNDDGAGGSSQQTNNGTTIPFGATISYNQAKNIAASLLQALAYVFGTDEERIFSELQGKNAKDFALISNEFGTPRYDGNGEAFAPFPKTPLTGWLSSELTQEEYNHLKQIMPGVL